MSMQKKNAARAVLAVAVSTLGVIGLTASQVSAADQPIARIAAQADQKTRAVAASNPSVVAAAGLLCGSGYNLYKAEMLPDSTRKGTLFVYVKGTNPRNNDTPTCATFYNNTEGAKWMKLKLCSNYTAEGCGSDEGSFNEFAGPVYRNHGGCGTVTALMKNSAGSSTYIINAIRDTTNCN
ncbi:hypothetical protein ACFWBX_27235 [Streptomyces sp. NPDC059991]|uniref:hypothetical protein n=1 Tax=Streptomyces sp. NPDC059991 TaxID=3347028 RepID=UPI00367B9A8C